MRPYKIYVHREDKTYKSLIKQLDNEKSLLGSDIDKDGRYYLIVDLDTSKLMQEFIKQNPKFAEKVKHGN